MDGYLAPLVKALHVGIKFRPTDASSGATITATSLGKGEASVTMQWAAPSFSPMAGTTRWAATMKYSQLPLPDHLRVRWDANNSSQEWTLQLTRFTPGNGPPIPFQNQAIPPMSRSEAAPMTAYHPGGSGRLIWVPPSPDRLGPVFNVSSTFNALRSHPVFQAWQTTGTGPHHTTELNWFRANLTSSTLLGELETPRCVPLTRSATWWITFEEPLPAPNPEAFVSRMDECQSPTQPIHVYRSMASGRTSLGSPLSQTHVLTGQGAYDLFQTVSGSNALPDAIWWDVFPRSGSSKASAYWTIGSGCLESTPSPVTLLMMNARSGLLEFGFIREDPPGLREHGRCSIGNFPPI